MKVLTIKEPFASLVANHVKKYETRSWQTKYRGIIYIHAGLCKINLQDERIAKLCQLVNVKPGYILCQATLKDCHLITNDFVAKLSEQEKNCGDYRLGRYAWELVDVKSIKPIAAKGHLSLWNYSQE
jgi:activating signal cointegrator 1